MKTTINQYEKSINKCYSVSTENVIDKAEYFTNKKEACKACRKYKKDSPNHNHAVSLIVWDEENEWYEAVGDFILYL